MQTPPNGLKSTLRMIIIDSSVLGQEASQLDLEFWPTLFLITVIVDARNHHHSVPYFTYLHN